MAKDSVVACGHLHSIEGASIQTLCVPIAVAVDLRIDAALQACLGLKFGNIIELELKGAAVA